MVILSLPVILAVHAFNAPSRKYARANETWSPTHEWIWEGEDYQRFGLVEWALDRDGDSHSLPAWSRSLKTSIFFGDSDCSLGVGVYQVLFIATTPLAFAGYFILRFITRRLRRGGHADGKAGDA